MTQPSIKQMKLYTYVERVRRELEARGLNRLSRLDPGALENVDQLHYLGLAAIEAALDVLDLGPGKHVLDVGAGLGGPARVLAERAGCKVTAVELQAIHFRSRARSIRAASWRKDLPGAASLLRRCRRIVQWPCPWWRAPCSARRMTALERILA